jgi:hypothetical protein
MKQSPLALAVFTGTLGAALCGSAQADFIKDSKASLGLRNFYINNDVRNEDKPSAKEWGQGFIFNYQSGFTEGPVGFGVDALGLAGVRLDSGGNTGKAGRSRTPGTLFPTSGGEAEDQFGSLGLTGKVKISKTVGLLGTLQPKLPVVVPNDGRLLPQTFDGGQITSNEFDNLTLIGGQLEHTKTRASTDQRSLAIGGADLAKGADTNKFYYGGLDYKLSKDLTAQYYYGNLQDFYKQHFLGLVHNQALPVGSLKTDLRYFYSTSDGKNASASGRTAGYTSNGYYGVDAKGKAITKGEVDNRAWSALFTYSLGGHSLSAGYQQLSGDSAFPYLNQGDGSTAYLITDVQINKFLSAGERTWLTGYAYDFAKLGVPGLKASVLYLNGDSIDAAGSDKQEWERDLRLDYVLQGGPLKGLGFTWRNAALRGNAQSDQDENRLIVSYTLPLL